MIFGISGTCNESVSRIGESLGGLKISVDEIHSSSSLKCCIFRRKGLTFSGYSSISQHNHLGFVVIAQACLSNRKELCDQLGLEDRSPSARVILGAYAFWGEECVKHLIGDFAFAIWDHKQKHLFLARSPFGHWMFYYTLLPKGGVAFSTMVQPLVEWAGAEKILDRVKVGHFLSLLTTEENTDGTFFLSIKKLQAGHTLLVRNNSLPPVIKAYWSIGEIKNKVLSSKNYFQDFRQLYQKVIEEKFTEGDSVCCQLSGGLDSSSVACMSAYLLTQKNKELVALCHIPTDGGVALPKKNFNYNDMPYIQTVASHWKNIRLHKIIDDHKRLFQDTFFWFPWIGQPILNPCNTLWEIVCIEEAQRLGFRKILTGQMGNFTLSWAGSSSQPKLWRTPRWFLGKKKLEFLEWKIGKRSKKPWGHFSAISDHLVQSISLLPSYRASSLIENYKKLEDPRDVFFSGNSVDYAASYTTMVEFLYGIHLDDPTADIRVVEFCLRCPQEVFKDKRGSRLLVREAMGELMPKMVRERTTKGMQAADWYKKIERQKSEIAGILNKWKNGPMQEFLNIPQLEKDWKKWDCSKIAKSQGFYYCAYEMQYRIKLLRGLEVGLSIEPYI